MSTVFLDTSYFKAFLDERDDFHEKAVSVFEKLRQRESQLLTTNFIVDETLTLLRVRRNLEMAVKFRDFLLAGSPTLVIYRVSSEDEANAWDWFQKDWSKLSFTDCTSFAVMKRLGLTSVATFDNHFSKAGFMIVI